MDNIDLIKVMEKEIDLIQGCIERMSRNAFYLKGWIITLIGIVVALKPKNAIIVSVSITIVIILFCYLDAVYLKYEKQYRELHKWVVKERIQGNDDYLYDLDSSRFKDDVDSVLKIMIKPTSLFFYLGLIISSIILVIAINDIENSKNIITIAFK